MEVDTTNNNTNIIGSNREQSVSNKKIITPGQLNSHGVLDPGASSLNKIDKNHQSSLVDDDDELEEGEVKDDDDEFIEPGPHDFSESTTAATSANNSSTNNTNIVAKPVTKIIKKKVRIVKVKRSKLKAANNKSGTDNESNSIATGANASSLGSSEATPKTTQEIQNSVAVGSNAKNATTNNANTNNAKRKVKIVKIKRKKVKTANQNDGSEVTTKIVATNDTTTKNRLLPTRQSNQAPVKLLEAIQNTGVASNATLGASVGIGTFTSYQSGRLFNSTNLNLTHHNNVMTSSSYHTSGPLLTTGGNAISTINHNVGGSHVLPLPTTSLNSNDKKAIINDFDTIGDEQERQLRLCEQQIKMLQEQSNSTLNNNNANNLLVGLNQGHEDIDDQLLLASAMDEDLRILPRPPAPHGLNFLLPPPQLPINFKATQTQFNNLPNSTSITVTTTTATPPLSVHTTSLYPNHKTFINNQNDTPMITPTTPMVASTTYVTTTQSAPDHHLNLQNLTDMNVINNNLHKSDMNFNLPETKVTPEINIGDDDLEDTKTSSYDAINKMLSMLRQSAQEDPLSSTDDSEAVATTASSSTSCDPSWHNIIGSPVLASTLGNSANTSENDSSYRLVPITVDGIDYSKYRALSQTNHKLRNDPRLSRYDDVATY